MLARSEECHEYQETKHDPRAHPIASRLDQAPGAVVLLETVAVVLHQDSEPAEAGCVAWHFHSVGPESRRSVGHVPHRLAAQHGMTNKWLEEQGLLSVKDLWVKLHYPATAR